MEKTARLYLHWSLQRVGPIILRHAVSPFPLLNANCFVYKTSIIGTERLTKFVSESANHDIYFVPGYRGLRILEILGAARLYVAERNCPRYGLEPLFGLSSVYTLRQMEFLKDGEQKNTYTLGAKVLNLGFAYLSNQPITKIARPLLAQLRDTTGVSTHLSVLEGHNVLYLGSHQARTGFVSNMVTGTRVEAYTTAIGWCLLSGKSDPN